MNMIRYPKGKLEYGLFYCISPEAYHADVLASAGLTREAQHHIMASDGPEDRTDQIDAGPSWADLSECDEVKEAVCRRDASHVLRKSVSRIVVDLHGMGALSPFICGPSGYLLATQSVADRLRCTDLKGARLQPACVLVQGVPADQDTKKLVLIEHAGDNAMLSQEVFPAEANLCPNCKIGLLVCECGEVSSTCNRCGIQRITRRRVEAESRQMVWLSPRNIPRAIVDPDRWDGKDFFSRGIVTRRVVDWLQSINAYPFAALPIPVIIREHEQQGRIKELSEQACRPVVVS